MARITVIDDDTELAENIGSVLQGHGHEVMLLDTTVGAVDALREYRPDLVILDVMFPNNPVAGFDLAREVRRAREIRSTPIILLTGINQEFPMGFTPEDLDPNWIPVQVFMEKPVDLRKLDDKVQEMLGEGATPG